jgi:hypothetical protein
MISAFHFFPLFCIYKRRLDVIFDTHTRKCHEAQPIQPHVLGFGERSGVENVATAGAISAAGRGIWRGGGAGVVGQGSSDMQAAGEESPDVCRRELRLF